MIRTVENPNMAVEDGLLKVFVVSTKVQTLDPRPMPETQEDFLARSAEVDELVSYCQENDVEYAEKELEGA